MSTSTTAMTGQSFDTQRAALGVLIVALTGEMWSIAIGAGIGLVIGGIVDLFRATQLRVPASNGPDEP